MGMRPCGREGPSKMSGRCGMWVGSVVLLPKERSVNPKAGGTADSVP